MNLLSYNARYLHYAVTAAVAVGAHGGVVCAERAVAFNA